MAENRKAEEPAGGSFSSSSSKQHKPTPFTYECSLTVEENGNGRLVLTRPESTTAGKLYEAYVEYCADNASVTIEQLIGLMTASDKTPLTALMDFTKFGIGLPSTVVEFRPEQQIDPRTSIVLLAGFTLEITFKTPILYHVLGFIPESEPSMFLLDAVKYELRASQLPKELDEATQKFVVESCPEAKRKRLQPSIAHDAHWNVVTLKEILPYPVKNLTMKGIHDQPFSCIVSGYGAVVNERKLAFQYAMKRQGKQI